MSKIAYVVDSIIPSKKANSVHTMHMGSALTKTFDECELFFKTKEKNFHIDEVAALYGVDKDIKVFPHYIKPGEKGKLGIFLQNYGLAKNVKKRGPFDFVYGRAIISLYLLRNYTDFCYEAHEFPENGLMRYLQKSMFKSKKCRGLVTISETLKQKYLQEFPFLKAEDITVMHDGADVPTEAVNFEKVPVESCDNGVVIGYLGHLYPGKCMEIICELAKIRPQYKFNVVGGTEEWIQKWTDYLKNNNIGNVILHGFVNNKDIGKWYAAFDIFLLPLKKHVTVVEKTGRDIGQWISPLKLFEAMSYKKAVLTSDLPTIREVLTDGEDGVFADSENIEMWGEKLDLLVSDENLRKKFGENSYNKLKNEYSWEKRAGRVKRKFEGLGNND